MVVVVVVIVTEVAVVVVPVVVLVLVLRAVCRLYRHPSKKSIKGLQEAHRLENY